MRGTSREDVDVRHRRHDFRDRFYLAGWLLEWVGRAFGVRGLTSTYEAFVESFVAWIGASSVMQILAPWFLMGVGAVLFAALRWPARKRSEEHTSELQSR